MIRKVLSLDSQTGKKKISKKITALAVSAVLGAMICMPVFADGIDPDPCKICGDGSIWVREEFVGSYTNGVERKCEHHKYGTDLQMVDHYLIHYECLDCGFVDTAKYNTTSWDCHGYDGPNND